MTDIILESLRAFILAGIVLFLWRAGQHRFRFSRDGWNLILWGFELLLFGSILDITDNFESLNRFILIGDTQVEAILEKFVGFLGGFICLAVGLYKWIPDVQNMTNLVHSQTRELRQTNENLAKSRESFEALSDNLPIFISLKDTEGKFQFVNKSFREWVQIKNEDIIGKTVFDIYPNEQAELFAARDLEAIETRSVISREIDLAYPDGQTRTVISTRFPVFSAANDIIGLGTTNFDITELRRAEKVKQEFLAVVSHELRTPLTSIKGSLGLIKSGATGPLPEHIRSMLDIAYTNSDRLGRLIDDILDIEKLETESLGCQLNPMDAVSLVEEAIEANKGYGEEHGVTFLRTDELTQAPVMGDKNRLMQVLSNLMSNAVKFSPKNGQVSLSVSQKNGNFCLSVTDNGPGIPIEFKETIFEKFTQIDSSDTRQRGGTGLGLSIAKTIINQHGGNIGFESEAGVATTFFITLPLLDAQT